MYTVCSPSLDQASMDSRSSWMAFWSLDLRNCFIVICWMLIILEQAIPKPPTFWITMKQTELRRNSSPSLLGSMKASLNFFNLSSGRASSSAQIGLSLPAGAEFWFVGRSTWDDGKLYLFAGWLSKKSRKLASGTPRNQKICSPACSSLGNKASILSRETLLLSS